MTGQGIGVVGAGVAGLHLGLYLAQRNVPVTLYAEATAEEVRARRLPNTVINWAPIRRRERELGVNHWDDLRLPGPAQPAQEGPGPAQPAQEGPGPDEPFGAHCIRFSVGAPEEPMRFVANMAPPAICIDQRIVTARLLEDFEARGGTVVVGPVAGEDVARLSEAHDLVVISAGRGSLTELWPAMPERCRFREPQRRLTAVMCSGVEYPPGRTGTSAFMVPGVGEIFELPMYSFTGFCTALLFEMLPGGPAAEFGATRYDEREPGPFEKAMLGIVEAYAPGLRERVDPAAFGVNRPGDVLQGAITPTVRRPWARLDNGRHVMAIGDQHVANDPITGQGAGAASAAAFVMGEAVVSHAAEGGAPGRQTQGFDEAFCVEVAERLWAAAQAPYDFNNLMLDYPPGPAVLEVVLAAAEHQAVADEMLSWFADPAAGWDVLATPERTRDHLRRAGVPTPVLDSVLGGS